MFGWGRAKDKTAPPVLDLDYLERLGGHIGPKVLSELLADGQIEVADRLEALRLAVDAANLAEIRRLAHDLTSVAGHLGLAALSLAAVEAEREIRDAEDRGATLEAAQVAAPLIAAGTAAQDALGSHLFGAR